MENIAQNRIGKGDLNVIVMLFKCRKNTITCLDLVEIDINAFIFIVSVVIFGDIIQATT